MSAYRNSSRLAYAGMGLLLTGWVGMTSIGALAEEGRGGRDGESRKERAEAGARPERREVQNVDAMERRLEELKGRIRALAEEGKREEAEAVEREAREVSRTLDRIRAERREHEAGRERPAGSRPDAERVEIERRLLHMRTAAENLAAAGMEDAAHRIMQEAGALERNSREGGGSPGQARPPVPPEALQRHVDELTGAVQDLRRQIENLQQQIREIREHSR